MAFTISEDEMSLEDYKNLYNAIVHMSIDIEGYDFKDAESLTKLKWVAAMIGCMNDVPKGRVNYYLISKGKEPFDVSDFVAENE